MEPLAIIPTCSLSPLLLPNAPREMFNLRAVFHHAVQIRDIVRHGFLVCPDGIFELHGFRETHDSLCYLERDPSIIAYPEGLCVCSLGPDEVVSVAWSAAFVAADGGDPDVVFA